MADCGCSDNPGANDTPPSGSSPVPSGAQSSFGGRITIPRKGCAPSPCPSPPVSNEQERAGYCPDWVQELIDATRGRLLLVTEDCLRLLQSKCGGFLQYDPTTEEVSVGDPPYVSAVPQETNYGFIAKVVPSEHRLCIDDNDECPVEIRQELAAQLIGETECGQLIIVNSPACGEIPSDQQADAGNQVRFDRAKLSDMGDVCADGFRLLAWYPSYRLVGGLQVPCKKFVSVPRLRMRKSQWSEVTLGSADDLAGYSLILVPVAGGTEGDQCYELRMITKKPPVPDGTECGDMLFWDTDADTDADPNPKWVAKPGGLTFHPLAAPVAMGTFTTHGHQESVTLSEFPESVLCGRPIFAVFDTVISVFSAGSGGAGDFEVGLGAGYAHTFAATDADLEKTIAYGAVPSIQVVQRMLKVTTAAQILRSVNNTGGSGNHGARVTHIGYYY